MSDKWFERIIAIGLLAGIVTVFFLIVGTALEMSGVSVFGEECQ